MRLATRSHRRAEETCAHQTTISLIHAGLEQIVCESCSEVRIEYRSMAVTRDLDRQSFARAIDSNAGHSVTSLA